jgi:hypothetical protein
MAAIQLGSRMQARPRTQVHEKIYGNWRWPYLNPVKTWTLSRSARQWVRQQRDRLQLIGGTRPGASRSLPSKSCTASSSSGCRGATSCVNTEWNDVPDEPAAMELELRARVTWLSRQMDFWCTLEHDMVPSSGGGNWVARMWAPASAPGHHVSAELQEGMSAYEWRPDPKRPCRARFRGPVVLLGLRQDDVTTSADFDRKLLHRLYAEHGLDDHGAPQDDRVWQTTPPRPTDPSDRANWQIVAAGAPKWLGKGWGMKVAKSELFGGRFELMPNSTLGEIDAELRRLQPLIERMAAH